MEIWRKIKKLWNRVWGRTPERGPIRPPRQVPIPPPPPPLPFPEQFWDQTPPQQQQQQQPVPLSDPPWQQVAPPPAVPSQPPPQQVPSQPVAAPPPPAPPSRQESETTPPEDDVPREAEPPTRAATSRPVSFAELGEALPAGRAGRCMQSVAVFSRSREAPLCVAVRTVSAPFSEGGVRWQRSDMRAFQQQWPSQPHLTENDALCQIVWHDEPLCPPPGVRATTWVDVPRAAAALVHEADVCAGVEPANRPSRFRVLVVDSDVVRVHQLRVEAAQGWFPRISHDDWNARSVDPEDIDRMLSEFVKANGPQPGTVVVVTPRVEALVQAGQSGFARLPEAIASARCPYFGTWDLLREYSRAWRRRLLAGEADWPPGSQWEYQVRSQRSNWGGLTLEGVMTCRDQVSISSTFALSTASPASHHTVFQVRCQELGGDDPPRQAYLEVDLRQGLVAAHEPLATVDVCPGTGAQRLRVECRGDHRTNGNGAASAQPPVVGWPRGKPQAAPDEDQPSPQPARITVCMTVDRAHTRPQYLQRAALLIHALAGRHRVGQFGIVVHDGTPGDKHLHFLQPGQFAPLSVYDLAHKIEQTTADPQGQVVADLPEAVVALLDRRTRQGASSGGTQVLLITESHFHLAAASKWHTGPGRWAWTINTRRLAGGPLSLAACLWKDLATARDETFRQVLEHLVLLGYQARCAHGLVRMWTPTSPYKLDRWAAAESDSLCAVSDRVTARAAQRQGVDTPGLPRPRTVWVTREHGELVPKTLHRHELMGGIEQDNLSDRPPSEEHVSFAYSGPLPSADAIRARLIGILRPTK